MSGAMAVIIEGKSMFMRWLKNDREAAEPFVTDDGSDNDIHRSIHTFFENL